MTDLMIPENRIPEALRDGKLNAYYNPFQFLPFLKIFTYDEKNGWEWNKNNLFIFDENGTGKTISALIILKEFLRIRHNNLSVLIVCENYNREKWYYELKKAGLYSNTDNTLPQQFTVICYDDISEYDRQAELIIFDDADDVPDDAKRLINAHKEEPTAPVIFMTSYFYCEEEELSERTPYSRLSGLLDEENVPFTCSDSFAVNSPYLTADTRLIENCGSVEAMTENIMNTIDEIMKAIIIYRNNDELNKLNETIGDKYKSYCFEDDYEKQKQSFQDFMNYNGKAVGLMHVNYFKLNDYNEKCRNFIYTYSPKFHFVLSYSAGLMKLDRKYNTDIVIYICNGEYSGGAKKYVTRHNKETCNEKYKETERYVKKELFDIEDEKILTGDLIKQAKKTR